jgi:Uma2 family endonuclease
MNIALLRALTVADYLDWASAQGEASRTELINGQIVAMSPEQATHNRIKYKIARAFDRALEAAALEAEMFTDGMTVPIDAHTAYEPDALVRCGEPIPGKIMTVADPVIIAEVISPTSAHTDTSAKLIGYFKLASVRHYLVIDPDTRIVTHHARDEAGAVTARSLSDGTLRLDPPGIQVEIADFFE